MWRATLVGTAQGGILGAGRAAHRARPACDGTDAVVAAVDESWH